MALTFEQLQKLLDEEKLRYFADAQQSALLVTLDYATCPPDHPNAAALFQALAAINGRRRFVKFAWNSEDGGIRVYADVWVMDGSVTQAQMHQICANYFTCIDDELPRIREALEKGVDPGPGARPPPPKPGAPGPVRRALDRLRGRKPPADSPGGTPTVEEI